MKQTFFLLLFSILVTGSTIAQEIKILTYNIFHGEMPEKPGTPNFEKVSDLFVLMQPEVVALQEVDSLTGRYLTLYPDSLDLINKFIRETGYRGYFGKAMNYDGGGYGEGLLVKKGSKYHTIQLPNPAGGESRAMAWVKAELKTLEEFYFGGTHLCHEFSENRIAQLDSILSYAETLDKPVIWAGDLNFTPDSEEYKRIPSHWKEAGAVAGNTQNTYGTAENGLRIDYIWYDSRKFELVEYKVIEVPYSDHYPVWAILRMKKEPQ
ncbi:endonuclease/exonuclease/phosphatase family protein [Algoriphagus sp. AK58]|uniref:endonuclease/exonuclease/phosphatase family protein n=1 Tax=Algoriphagus sp. AK58 TaxID=1406877 RepID=UPI00164F6E4B|nr:endonuclease/exonuclease/phosphatase family protein [Algoriphagus sp. AK58]MBC6368835.1 endonuclease [Algoriphagus sp. AK58]